MFVFDMLNCFCCYLKSSVNNCVRLFMVILQCLNYVLNTSFGIITENLYIKEIFFAKISDYFYVTHIWPTWLYIIFLFFFSSSTKSNYLNKAAKFHRIHLFLNLYLNKAIQFHRIYLFLIFYLDKALKFHRILICEVNKMRIQQDYKQIKF